VIINIGKINRKNIATDKKTGFLSGFCVLKKAVSISLALTLAACSVNQTPITSSQRSDRVNRDLQEIFSRQEPITGPLSLYEAMARAIKYNLDHRVKLMEEVLAQGVADLSSYEMLPKIAASSGYSIRNNESGSYSTSLLTGNDSLEFSSSQEKSSISTDLSVSWNVLDFGVSYITAQQNVDKAYIAKELRRKAVQNIVHDVKSAFWRAVGAQRLQKDLDYLLEDVQDALDKSRAIEEKRLKAPEEALAYQKDLLSSLRQLLALKREVSFSKLELAALMNLDPAIDFTLDEKSMPEYNGSDTELPMRMLEQQALMNRPELRMEDYEARISAGDVKKELLRLLPGIELSTDITSSTNKYLYNKNWAESGLKITYNLMNMITGNKNVDLAKNKQEITHLRRLALNVAVLTQVHVAYRRLKQAREEYDVSLSLNDINNRLYKHSMAKDSINNSKNSLETIKIRTELLFSRLRKDFSFAELQDSESGLFLSLGVDPMPQIMTTSHVMAIADTLENKLSKWDSGDWERDFMKEYKRGGNYNRGLYADFDKNPYRDARPYEEDGEEMPEIGKWAVGDWLDDVVTDVSIEKDKDAEAKKTRLSFIEKKKKAAQRRKFEEDNERYGYGHRTDLDRPTFDRRAYEEDLKNSGIYASKQDLEYDDRQSRREINSYSDERRITPRNINSYRNSEARPTYDEAPIPYNNIERKPVKKSPSIKKSETSSGNYMQLGAYSTSDIADKEWKEMTDKYPELSSYPVEVRKSNVSGMGTLYRLMIKDNSKGNLDNLCDGLKKSGQDCMVR